MRVKSRRTNTKPLRWGCIWVAIFLQSIGLYLLYYQEYQRFLFYSFFAAFNVCLAFWLRPTRNPTYTFDEEGEVENVIFAVDLNSPKEINKILAKLYFHTVFSTLQKHFGNKEGYIDLVFVHPESKELHRLAPQDSEANDKIYPSDSIRAFCYAACQFESSRKQAVKLFKQIIDYNERIREYGEPLRINQEAPYGLFFGEALVNYSKDYCHLYGEFLKTLDMDHEVCEADVIDNAFKRYSCCTETLDLVAIRCTSACGQHGDMQLTWLIDGYDLNGFLADKMNFQTFLERLIKEVKEFDIRDRTEFCESYLELGVLKDNPDTPMAEAFKALHAYFEEMDRL